MICDIARVGVFAFALMGPVAGCTNLAPFTADTAEEEPEHTGNIGLELEIAAGITLASVSYEISGHGFVKQGQVDVSQSPVLTAMIGGIPAGDGYTIVVSASTIDGGVNCAGTATFSVMENLTTRVEIHLQCRFGRRPGRVLINGEVNACPVIDELTATPMETGVGGTITFLGKASDPDGPATSLDVTFSNGAVSLSQHGRDTSAISLTCSQPGSDRVTLTVSDGDCLQASSVDITCSGAGGDGGAQAVWVWHQLM